jgi:hypothetical protein
VRHRAQVIDLHVKQLGDAYKGLTGSSARQVAYNMLIDKLGRLQWLQWRVVQGSKQRAGKPHAGCGRVVH